ncbi:MAG: exopolysaccharide biosynthesis polyprenyl glycosylphosphotransferase [Candidatus Gracilibacteria bacterium]|nr:exopolysaccharide biosynthesis polyprenyl glycosylphosphotransferase [Candidatus Gracilibacteria bacterium]
MKKHEIIFSIIKLPIDFLIIFFSFFLAKNIREYNDFIPGIQLPVQIINDISLIKFALFGSILYLIIFSIHGLYSLKITSSKIKEFFDIILYSLYWFMFFSLIVYFGKGFFFLTDIPRLVILFTLIIGIIGVLLERIILNKVQNILLEKGIISKRKVVLINNKDDEKIIDILKDIKQASIYKIIGYINLSEIENTSLKYLGNDKDILNIIVNRNIDEILYIDSDFNSKDLYNIWDYSRIYGIRYRYITNTFDVTKTNTTISLLNKIPVIEIKNTSLDAWGRVIKRLLDIIFSFLLIIIFLPFFIIIGILIKLEDKDGPVIYKNLRIGQNGEKFNLYKFRYLKWEYCIKDSYGVKSEDDEALKYEQKLIKERSTRNGPLYKIKDDPRKTNIGKFIEKYSIDELPQLFNVFLGNMSLVGPRPHQPREVEKYLIHQKRVLTIKPGITGLAQVNGRENNKFDDEINLDIFYIENWNFLLDIKIFLKTFTIVLNRK